LLGDADPAAGMIDVALAVDVTDGAERSRDSINPDANVVAEVVEEAAERDLELTGLAHSHPSGCVYPSPTDLDSGSTIRHKFRLPAWVVLIGVPDSGRWQLVPWVVRPGGRTDWCERSRLSCAALL
jgi:proteasome lid subunit RPN8/RPN11